MLFGKLHQPQTYIPFLAHPIWAEAIQWIRSLPPAQVPGIYHLRGEQMFVNLHGYDTQPREACRYESHRRYIDLQYCISGGEGIEWHALDELLIKDEYDPLKDVIHYHSPGNPSGILQMTPGSLAIFFPQDGHMPKVTDGIHPAVEKAVIKIAVEMLGGASGS